MESKLNQQLFYITNKTKTIYYPILIHCDNLKKKEGSKQSGF